VRVSRPLPMTREILPKALAGIGRKKGEKKEKRRNVNIT